MSISFRKKILTTSFSMFVVGIVATVSVFAAIPDSSTKVITACRNNSNGGIKVIDAQNGAVCGGSETLLTWGGEQTAVVHISNDDTSTYPFKYEPLLSRNVVSTAQSVGVGVLDGFCVDLPFTPIHSSDQVNMYYRGNMEPGQDLTEFCGSGTNYDAFIWGGVGSYLFSE